MKVSIRFFNDREVRAAWDDASAKWYFCAVDVVASLSGSENPANYWYVLKNRLKKADPELLTKCKGFKMTANDGKRRMMDCFDGEGIVRLAKDFPGNRAAAFLDWFLYSDNTIDGQSRKKAYELFESGLLDKLEPGTVKCLQQIHGYIFGGLYDFAGQIRTKNISKGGFAFANCRMFGTILPAMDRMPETTFDEILSKYVEMNVVHPFMEGNGRSTRIWLDLMLKRSLKKCVDWSRIDKQAYLSAMRASVTDDTEIRRLVGGALTDEIGSREMFMKGIDYSYYYEQEDTTVEDAK